MNEANPNLYGIVNSNRATSVFWSKNNFNSSFPVSMACYMRDNRITANYLYLDDELNIAQRQISIDEVFNCERISTNELYFGFEIKYDPYQSYSYRPLDHIDLVIKDLEGNFLRPLEVKLTVLPDKSTLNREENHWGSELVIRPDTTSYCALGIVHEARESLQDVRNIFEPVCHDIQSWSNQTEMLSKMNQILNAIDDFESNYLSIQKPLIMQPIWKTLGQSPHLDNQAFDIFVWSDFAFTRLFLDSSRIPNNRTINRISRQMRSSLRFARCLYEISRSGRVNLQVIYSDMTFGHQTDKEFSVNGKKTNRYMNCDRLRNPILPKEIVSNLILNGGEELLRPERRFDQTIYFTMSRGE